jgi:ABC-2 type transport system permease protein
VTTTLASMVSTAERPPSGAYWRSKAFWLPVWTLTVRELVRFFRQRTRIVGALGQPVIFWILFGAGLGGSFKNPEWVPEGVNMTYQEYFFPGVAVLILLFTAIFSTISIIEDRREGFLQGVLVSPISRVSLVLGKISGGTVLAVVQAVAFLLLGPLLHMVGLAPTISMSPSFVSVVSTFAFLVLLGFALTALGYLIAWPLGSTQGFHAIMSVFLFPMWLLSGAFFPGEQAGWLTWIIKLNPLTYGVAGLRRLMYPQHQFPATDTLPSLAVCLVVTFLFCTFCFGLSVLLTRRTTSKDTR